jgi:hypothetical protein
MNGRLGQCGEGMEGDLAGEIASHQLIVISSNRMLCGLSA